MKDPRAREAQRFMMSVYWADCKITSKLEEVSRLRSLATITAAAMGGERVKGSGYPVSKLEDTVIKIVELEADVDRCVDSMIEQRKSASVLLSRLQDDRERLILEERYWNRKSWDQIMEMLFVERAHVFRLHGSALLHLYDLIHIDD